METPNAGQRDFWTGPSGQSWIENQEEQDAVLSGVSAAILARAAPAPGQRVLDIGCGTGALSIAVAGAVGRGGRVLATDISELLLDVAARRGAGLAQMATLLADAQVADWPETGFDLAVSRFGVMFFADPAAAFANIARALRPGGRMVFAAWAGIGKNPWWELPRQVATDLLGPTQATPPNAPGPLGLADVGWALRRFRAGGLGDAACEEVRVDVHHPGGVRALAELTTRLGPAKRVITERGGNERDARAVADGIAAAFARYAATDGARVPAVLNMFTATAP